MSRPSNETTSIDDEMDDEDGFDSNDFSHDDGTASGGALDDDDDDNESVGSENRLAAGDTSKNKQVF